MTKNRDEDRTPGPPINKPEKKPLEPPHRDPGVVLRCPFDPTIRRQQMVARLLELRSTIPVLEEEKMRLEGSIQLLDEINPPNPMGFPMTEGTEDLDGDDGPNGRPGEG